MCPPARQAQRAAPVRESRRASPRRDWRRAKRPEAMPRDLAAVRIVGESRDRQVPLARAPSASAALAIANARAAGSAPAADSPCPEDCRARAGSDRASRSVRSTLTCAMRRLPPRGDLVARPHHVLAGARSRSAAASAPRAAASRRRARRWRRARWRGRADADSSIAHQVEADRARRDRRQGWLFCTQKVTRLARHRAPAARHRNRPARNWRHGCRRRHARPRSPPSMSSAYLTTSWPAAPIACRKSWPVNSRQAEAPADRAAVDRDARERRGAHGSSAHSAIGCAGFVEEQQPESSLRRAP